ncbi:hypothetical protein JMUB7543_28480 [Staphylococcus aureus]
MYKRQLTYTSTGNNLVVGCWGCLLYTSDAADELDGVDLGGRRIIKKHTHLTLPTICSV